MQENPARTICPVRPSRNDDYTDPAVRSAKGGVLNIRNTIMAWIIGVFPNVRLNDAKPKE